MRQWQHMRAISDQGGPPARCARHCLDYLSSWYTHMVSATVTATVTDGRPCIRRSQCTP